MQLFGFLGPFRGSHGALSLVEYGRSRVVADQEHTASDEASQAACWGPVVATHGGTSIVLQGELLSIDGSGAHPVENAAQRMLDAYRRDPARALDGLGGRFAVAILDRTARRALLAVDPMGIERLTYAACGGGLIFGSSAESVARFPPLAAPLRPQALFDYLMLHMVPGPETVFEGVHKIPPGHCVLYDDGALQLRRYWHPSFVERGGESFETLKQRLHDTLRDAVSGARPDERTGAFLSGGLDSSTVAGVLSEVGPSKARTFSIGFGYPDYDELPYARIASQRFSCQAHEYVVTGADIAASFVEIARAYDEPFGNSSALPLYYCARLAKDSGVDHLLAGDGGDELFAGNSRYAEQQIFERYRLIPAALRRTLLEPVIKHWPRSAMIWPVRKARGYVEKANISLPARFEMWNLVRVLGTAELLHPEFATTIDFEAPLAQMQRVWDAAPTQNLLNRMLYYDWYYTLADNDLRKVETMSALAGVRVSYPMLHPQVVNMSLQVPPHLKMPGMQLRHFFKRAMAEFLPQEIIDKKKHGFGLPFGLWLQDSPALREQILGYLAHLRSRNIIRPQFIDRLLNLHGSEDARYYGVLVWVLAMLEQWLQEHRSSP